MTRRRVPLCNKRDSWRSSCDTLTHSTIKFATRTDGSVTSHQLYSRHQDTYITIIRAVLLTRHNTNLTDITRNTVHTGLLATTDYRQTWTRTPNWSKLSLPEWPTPTSCTKLRHWAWFSSVDCLRLRASVTTLALPGWYWIYNRKHLSQQNFWFVSLFKSHWSNKY